MKTKKSVMYWEDLVVIAFCSILLLTYCMTYKTGYNNGYEDGKATILLKLEKFAKEIQATEGCWEDSWDDTRIVNITTPNITTQEVYYGNRENS